MGKEKLRSKFHNLANEVVIQMDYILGGEILNVSAIWGEYIIFHGFKGENMYEVERF
jgi:hypothetical protein